LKDRKETIRIYKHSCFKHFMTYQQKSSKLSTNPKILAYSDDFALISGKNQVFRDNKCWTGQRCFCLWGFISDSSKSLPGPSQARRFKGRKKFQTCGT